MAPVLRDEAQISKPGLSSIRLYFLVFGFVPVSSISANLWEFVPLHITAKYVVLPLAFVSVLLGLSFRTWGRLALVGLGAGIVATAGYDVSRLAFVHLGLWEDFIPNLGRLAWNDPQAHWSWGYLWRFLGNGGAMGVAFAMLPCRGVRAGTIYGVMICMGLFTTQMLCSTEALFPMTIPNMLMALIGHIEYGAILGKLLHRWDPSGGRI